MTKSQIFAVVAALSMTAGVVLPQVANAAALAPGNVYRGDHANSGGVELAAARVRADHGNDATRSMASNDHRSDAGRRHDSDAVGHHGSDAGDDGDHDSEFRRYHDSDSGGDD